MATEMATEMLTAVVPWGAVAADISRLSAADEEGLEELGRSFCFLPLPGPNGLPCHVNGYFELSSNR
jgi:hypothetical protein